MGLSPIGWSGPLAIDHAVDLLLTWDAYVCGWCELDRNSEWLTLIPHPMSPASSRRWKYRTEIECVGRIVAVAIRLAE
jgi:hypothetical protein